MKDKKIITTTQHGCIKGESCLINLITIYNEMTGLREERRAADIVCPDFIRLSAVSHKMLIEMLLKHGLDRWTVKPTDNLAEWPGPDGW